MRIGLIGSSGYISGYIRNRFIDKQIIKIDKSGDYDHYLDLNDYHNFDYELFNDLNYLIFTAAVSSPDLCQNKYDECYKINVEGTSYVIEEAINRKVRVIFFSSDAVFGNHPDEVFNEDSKTETEFAYGQMKKAVEDKFKDNVYFKAIRLSYVVSKNDKFVSYCLKCLDNKEVCEVYDPFMRNCITVDDVLDSIEWLINNFESFNSSFLNIAGKELISREDIVKILNKIFDNGINYKVIYPGEKFYNSRPRITRMESEYLYEYKIISDDSFMDKLIKQFD